MSVGRRTLVAVLVAAALLVGGCSIELRHDVPDDATEGGQTLADMETAVAAIPGVHLVDVGGGGALNMKGNTGYAFRLELESGWEIVDGVALVDFLMATARNR